jgi:hypothetical protein
LGVEPLYAKKWTVERLIEHQHKSERRQQGDAEGRIP